MRIILDYLISGTGTVKALVMLSLLLTVPIFADYELVWSTIDGGGGRSTGGDYALTGTIGQPDAAYSQGGDYEVLGGFWPGGPLCFVEFDDFARFAQYWLDTGCSPANNWCQGADLDQLNDVGVDDLNLFIIEWLYECPYGWPLK